MVGFPWTCKYMIILPQVLSLVGYNLLSISAQIILDVPTVGGRLMLVDMAGSENIEQAGEIGFEAKMQTAKINQGNIALKRVVESIANGDSHVPFRDSKLTMLLQTPEEIHKTISTLEYGAKAKCIVRGPHMLIKDKIGTEDSSAVILGSRIAAMDEFILKLQRENKHKEKERNEAHRELQKKEDVAALRAKLELMEGTGSGKKEEEINLKVTDRELENKLEECQRMANEFVELERRRMEERILQQQQEAEMLWRQLEEIELELCRSGDGNGRMVKSMDLDMGDQEPFAREVKYVGGVAYQSDSSIVNAVNIDSFEPKYADRVCLRTIFEEEEMEEEEGLKENVEAEEVEKEVIEEKRVCMVDGSSLQSNYNMGTTESSLNIIGFQGELRPFADADIEVYLKWEASKENPGKFITTLKVVKDASLADLRKLIAIYLGADNHAFIFLMLGVCHF
ncbi:unnamed protein product [Prunus armeniaca]